MAVIGSRFLELCHYSRNSDLHYGRVGGTSFDISASALSLLLALARETRPETIAATYLSAESVTRLLGAGEE